jgi:hypothetical protein
MSNTKVENEKQLFPVEKRSFFIRAEMTAAGCAPLWGADKC